MAYNQIEFPSLFRIMFVFALIVIVVLVVVLTTVGVVNRKSHLSGESGEKKTSNLLSIIKENDEFIIDNYLASRNDNKTESIQIDHILISHKGVFVIETKDFRGRIYGSDRQHYWTQVLAYGNTKNKLYNPIKQNQTHCNYISKLIKRDIPVYNVVVFIDADISRVDDSTGSLFEPSSFKYWYRSLPFCHSMTEGIIRTIHGQITNQMTAMPISKEEHIRNIRRKHK